MNYTIEVGVKSHELSSAEEEELKRLIKLTVEDSDARIQCTQVEIVKTRNDSSRTGIRSWNGHRS